MTARKTHLALRAASPAKPRLVALGAVALSALLAGCAASTAERYDHIYPIAVELAPTMLELPAETTLSSFDARRVDAFGRDFMRTGDGELTIAFPSGSQSGRTVAETAARLRHVGVPAERIVHGPYSVEADGDRGLVLSYFAPTATPTDCPEHPMDSTRDLSNQTPIGFGCSVRNNIAAMLEDPRDVIAPRPATPPSADRRHTVLEAYALGEVTASANESDAAETVD